MLVKKKQCLGAIIPSSFSAHEILLQVPGKRAVNNLVRCAQLCPIRCTSSSVLISKLLQQFPFKRRDGGCVPGTIYCDVSPFLVPPSAEQLTVQCRDSGEHVITSPTVTVLAGLLLQHPHDLQSGVTVQVSASRSGNS